MSPETTRQANEQMDELLSKGWIVPSKSPWGAGVVMVSKKGTNELRMCVDYRMLNEYTVKDAYPLRRIDDSMTNLGDARYMSKFDFGRAFHQVQIESVTSTRRPSQRREDCFIGRTYPLDSATQRPRINVSWTWYCQASSKSMAIWSFAMYMAS